MIKIILIPPSLLLPLLPPLQGDSTIYAHEVGVDSPHLFPLTHHKCSTVHQVSVCVGVCIDLVVDLVVVTYRRITMLVLSRLHISYYPAWL